MFKKSNNRFTYLYKANLIQIICFISGVTFKNFEKIDNLILLRH